MANDHISIHNKDHWQSLKIIICIFLEMKSTQFLNNYYFLVDIGIIIFTHIIVSINYNDLSLEKLKYNETIFESISITYSIIGFNLHRNNFYNLHAIVTNK